MNDILCVKVSQSANDAPSGLGDFLYRQSPLLRQSVLDRSGSQFHDEKRGLHVITEVAILDDGFVLQTLAQPRFAPKPIEDVPYNVGVQKIGPWAADLHRNAFAAGQLRFPDLADCTCPNTSDCRRPSRSAEIWSTGVRADLGARVWMESKRPSATIGCAGPHVLLGFARQAFGGFFPALVGVVGLVRCR